MKKVLKIIGIIFIIIIILVTVLVAILFFYVKGKLGKINYMEIDESELNISDQAQNSLSKYRNIVIYGIDNRDQTADKEADGNLSDCIMVASINQETNEIKLVSFYRDTYLDLGETGYGNLNQSYSRGGVQLAIATLNKNFDLNITEFVSANFDSVIILVDRIGGIELDITEDDIEYINTYIDNLEICTGKSAEHITTPGHYTLNGVQAMAYSRIRYDGGEKKRTERIRTVLTKCFEKIKNEDVVELNSLADELLPYVSTNLTEEEILELIPSVSKYSITQLESCPYKLYTNFNIFEGDSLWHQIPCTLESNVIELHKNLFPDVEYTPSETVKQISEHIKEVTGMDENSYN